MVKLVSCPSNYVVLSLFTGIDLLGKAFELEGFTVVGGPDLLWGRDVRDFHVPPGVFDGVIGGPPCQKFSQAKQHLESPAVDLIPEFVRLVNEAQPRWVAMENVMQAKGHPSIPEDWQVAKLRDFDCGGETFRRRLFWTHPFSLEVPPKRPGTPSRSVCANTYKLPGADSPYMETHGYLPGNLPLAEYERLQGAPGITATAVKAGCSKQFAIYLLGNGVPIAMGRYVAKAVKRTMFSEGFWEPKGGRDARDTLH